MQVFLFEVGIVSQSKCDQTEPPLSLLVDHLEDLEDHVIEPVDEEGDVRHNQDDEEDGLQAVVGCIPVVLSSNEVETRVHGRDGYNQGQQLHPVQYICEERSLRILITHAHHQY